ncbi:hypothetical protein P389DRAFT_196356 [Cystobasidium minutum MCA 4210]|uniref:uncharacterized protein n=1 Tax=Cystobasidium minutum MCA 4210 TaxID=1397322 RepID=UPI0034CF3390|eukprot:jgi/Rhomi1/196356/gm1.4570_g
MAIIHIVHFAYSCDEATKQEIARRFLQMKTQCVSQSDSKPYILSLTGGKNNSPEGMNDGLEHTFVVKFANNEDRAYYLDEDPVHQEFKKFALSSGVSKGVVLDFDEDQF